MGLPGPRCSELIGNPNPNPNPNLLYIWYMYINICNGYLADDSGLMKAAVQQQNGGVVVNVPDGPPN